MSNSTPEAGQPVQERWPTPRWMYLMPDDCPNCGEVLSIRDERGGFCAPCQGWTVPDLPNRLRVALEARDGADRQRIAELEARLVRCGGENCMGFDASKPGWRVARWVREERLQAAEARIAELETLLIRRVIEANQSTLNRARKAEAERDALRVWAKDALSIYGRHHAGCHRHYLGIAFSKDSDCDCGLHEAKTALPTPAASQEEGP